MLRLVSGPSGAGKSTFVGALLKDDPRVAFSVSTTTRPMRPGETDGVEYRFVDDARFDALIAEDAFVEWAHVHDRRYGTRRSDIETMIADGLIPLLDLDVQGGKNVIDIYGEDLVSVFIFPPSWEVLEKRLRGRNTDDDAVIRTRLKNARWEVDYAQYYDYFIVNDDLPSALAQMKAILTAEGLKRARWPKTPLVDE